MKKIILILLGSLLFLTGCFSDEERSNQQKNEKTEVLDDEGDKENISVYTSIYPLYYIAKEIGGENIELKSVVPEGTDPHEFEPSLRDVGDIRESDLFIYNGAGLETWAEGLSSEMEEDKVLVASDCVELISIDDNDDHGHDHDHGDKDPHIWLNPNNMKNIAESIEERLAEIDPENRDSYIENKNRLIGELDLLDEKYKTQLESKTSDKILVSHKAFGYLTREYGLEQIAITGISPQAEPSPRTITELLDIAESERLEYIYFEVLASPRSVQMIAEEAHLEALTLNPIGGLTPDDIEHGEDYLSLMEKNLESLKKELLK